MFFIFGFKTKLLGKSERKIVTKDGFANAIIKVYRYYFELFFIPLIPLKRKYSIYIPRSDEYYETHYFSNDMPAEYLAVCKDVGRLY